MNVIFFLIVQQFYGIFFLFRWKCLRCDFICFATKQQVLNHLALEHYKGFLLNIEYLMEQYANKGEPFSCSQLGCDHQCNTIEGLVLHENMAHDAMEEYFGDFIETNDVFAEL